MTQKRKKGPALRWIILILAAIVFVFCAWKLGSYTMQGVKTQKDFSSLKINGRHDLVALHRKNSDVVGWIKINGTRIDYPVMQTPEDPEFYLRKNFNKQYSLAGTPFMDAASRRSRSKNFLIYGHNMKSGTMFHSLLNYEKNSFAGSTRRLPLMNTGTDTRFMARMRSLRRSGPALFRPRPDSSAITPMRISRIRCPSEPM